MKMEFEPGERINEEDAKEQNSQNITFSGSETSFPLEPSRCSVNITCHDGAHQNGVGSKVRLTNLVDYHWEQRFLLGDLIDVHLQGRLFAYGLKGKTGNMVRVSTVDCRLRALIKGILGNVEDLSFAHSAQHVLLAIADDLGYLQVYRVHEETTDILCTLLLNVKQEEAECMGVVHRVIWCPFLPDDDNSREASRLLLFTAGKQADLLNLAKLDSMSAGMQLITSLSPPLHIRVTTTAPLTCGAFAPDGTAFAVAGTDGAVHFFQVYLVGDQPTRCLHKWFPHDGLEISWIGFLDDYRLNGFEERFWKYAVTAAKQNTQLRIWSCESWECFQTINFGLKSPNAPLQLKPRMDISASYLFLSDVDHRTMYVLDLYRDKQSSSGAYATSINEVLLPANVLSFAVVQVTDVVDDADADGDGDIVDDVDVDDSALTVRLFVIQPKRLQECQLVLHPCAVTKSESLPLPSFNLMKINGAEEETAIVENGETPLITFASGGSSPSREVQQILAKETNTSPLATPPEYLTILLTLRRQDEQLQELQTEVRSSAKQQMQQLQQLTTAIEKQTKLIEQLPSQIATAVQLDSRQIITDMEQAVIKQINQTLNNKSMINNLATNTANILKPMVERSSKEMLQSMMLPSLDKMCKELLIQLSQVFNQGTKEYVESFAMHTQTLQQQMINVFTLQQQQLQQQQQQQQQKQQQQCDTSQVDPKMQVQLLLNDGKIHEALQLALNASDLSLVTYVCEQTNPQQLINQSMQQHVLLSLMQQLSADLTQQTDLKLRFLEESLLSVDHSVVSREHLALVSRQLRTFIAHNPNHKLIRQLRMLLLATQTLMP